MKYQLDRFTLDTSKIDSYPINFIKATYVAKYYPSLLKNEDVKEYVQKAIHDYENRYEVSVDGLPDYLFDFQKKDLAFALKVKRAALFLEQGMGKTVIGVEWAKRVPKPVLVVTKKRIIPNWIEHFKLYAPELKVATLDSPYRVADVFVVNYENLHKVENLPFKSLIVDESHACKSLKAQRTKRCLEIAKKVEYVLLLSGTPITRAPEDIYPQMRMLYPLLFVNFEEFRKDFVILDRTGTFPVGYKNLDKLIKRVQAVSVIRKKEDFLSLPEKIEEIEFVEPSKEQVEVSLELQTKFEWRDVKIDNYLVLYQKLHQVSAGFVYNDQKQPYYLESGKTERLKELLEDVNEQFIVWYLFKAEGDRLEQVLRESGVKVVRVESGVRDADQKIETFRKGKADVLLANISSLSEGVNLQNCSLMIYHSLPWSYKDFAQSIERVHRPGQKNTVRVKILLLKDFIDLDVMEALKRKEDFTPHSLSVRFCAKD